MLEHILARRPAPFPDARVRRAFRVAQLDRADRPVDRHAGVAKFEAKALRG